MTLKSLKEQTKMEKAFKVELYKYDAKGNVIKSTFQFYPEEWTKTYTYLKFDAKGNWTKRKVKSTIDKPTIETRTITYYE